MEQRRPGTLLVGPRWHAHGGGGEAGTGGHRKWEARRRSSASRRLCPWFQASSDGKRFLVMEPEGGTERDLRMVVIQNWPAKLGNQP